MFLVMEDDVYDFDLELLSELLAVLDGRLARILNCSVAPEIADQLGYFDGAEYVIGMGLVACQTYLPSVYGDLGIPKAKALKAGPCHAGGLPIAEAINQAANYWKHREEWVLESRDARRQRVVEAFEAVGHYDGDYPLMAMLGELVGTEALALSSLVPLLTRWRDELRRPAPD